MSFIRKVGGPDRIEHLRGGAGYVLNYPILNGPEEMDQKGRVFQHMVLEPGCEVGLHQHVGDAETYYILKGTGTYYEGDNHVTVGPGDVTFCDDGESHGLLNDGTENLEYIALILYTK